MKNKVLKYFGTIGALLLACLMFSCQDFLTVRPKYSYPDYLMFKSEGGFQDAMVGVYIGARDQPYSFDGGLFGGIDPGTGGAFIEALSCFWPVWGTNSTDSRSYSLYRHDYTSEEGRSAGDLFYRQQHAPVTNVNFILKWIDDEDQDFLSDEVYSVIKAEALGMRALCMFDVIRTYGPPPTETSMFNELYAAYPKTIQTGSYSRETYTDFMNNILSDINTAEELMEGYDPIVTYGPDNTTTGSVRDWLTARRSKMNYYAIKALKARIYLWMGGDQNKAVALECAKTVIESGHFAFDTWDSYDTKAMGTQEHIFALMTKMRYMGSTNDSSVGFVPFPSNATNYNAFNIHSWNIQFDANGNPVPPVDSLHSPHRDHLLKIFPGSEFDYDLTMVDVSQTSSGTSVGNVYTDYRKTNLTITSDDLRMQLQMMYGALENTGSFLTGASMYLYKSSGIVPVKHATFLERNDQIPVLRLAEMYLIAAECEPSLSAAQEYINTLRSARWKKDSPKTSHVVTLSNETERMEWIIGEYVREFYLEGQIFFLYKRLNLGQIPYASAQTDEAFYGGDVLMTPQRYILPLPETEF